MGIRIISGGLLTTVQDRGRHGYMRFGMTPAGAMDERSYMIANLLVGNEGGEAALEATVIPPQLEFTSSAVFAVTGGDFRPLLNGREIPMYSACRAQAGDRLTFGGRRTGCRVYIGEEDLFLPPMLTAGQIYYTDNYGEGDTVTVAGLSFAVLRTPGHTSGCVCLLCEDTMFSGDTLFAGTCGRTDLPGGSHFEIMQSLARLAKLDKDYRVLPGHGEETTLSRERRFNPFMQDI